jgi:hypothetical protein
MGTKTYHPTIEDFDTRIHEYDENHQAGEFATYQEAREAAMKYLRELIGDCHACLEHFERAEDSPAKK